LRLIDDQHIVLLQGMRGQQEGIQWIDEILDRCNTILALADSNAEFVTDRSQKFDHRLFRIEDVRDIAVCRNLLQEEAAYRRLACTDLAGQEHEPATAIQAVQKVRQRLPMPLAHEEVARVRCDREGNLAEAKESGVHGRRLAQSLCRLEASGRGFTPCIQRFFIKPHERG
jgi:hypothetical protein